MSESKTFEEILEKDGVLVYTCRGFSMRPLLRQHEDLLVIHRPEREFRKYDIVLFRAGAKYLLHRIVKIDGDYIITAGDHNAFKDSKIHKDRVIGILTSFVRNGREINIDELPLRIYGHVAGDLIDAKILARGLRHKMRDLLNRNRLNSE